MSDYCDLSCSRCPLLDLGRRYPPNDQRDPWRRMPQLFQICLKTFGRGMMAHTGRTREAVELRLGHYCRKTRERHGPCSDTRITLCQGALDKALTWAGTAQEPQAAMRRVITALNTNEEHQAALKATVVAPPRVGIPIPPISLRRLEDDE